MLLYSLLLGDRYAASEGACSLTLDRKRRKAAPSMQKGSGLLVYVSKPSAMTEHKGQKAAPFRGVDEQMRVCAAVHGALQSSLMPFSLQARGRGWETMLVEQRVQEIKQLVLILFPNISALLSTLVCGRLLCATLLHPAW